jgi:hypothetical protein
MTPGWTFAFLVVFVVISAGYLIGGVVQIIRYWGRAKDDPDRAALLGSAWRCFGVGLGTGVFFLFWLSEMVFG